MVLALFQSFGIAIGLSNSQGVVDQPGLFFILSTVASLTGGTMFLMWLGEQITARGRRQRRLADHLRRHRRAPAAGLTQLLTYAREGTIGGFTLLMIAVMAVGVVMFIVFIERSQRRLLIQYPKRQMAIGCSAATPRSCRWKLNTSGVIPPIFASSLLLMPTTAINFIPLSSWPSWAQWIPTAVAQLQHGRPAFIVAYAFLIIFFCFFYTSIVFNRKRRPRTCASTAASCRHPAGKRTADYLDYVLTRLTVIGAGYITLVCLLPEAFMAKMGGSLYFGGTSILITVTVTMDTVAQIQSHLLAHQYEGLLKSRSCAGA